MKMKQEILKQLSQGGLQLPPNAAGLLPPNLAQASANTSMASSNISALAGANFTMPPPGVCRFLLYILSTHPKEDGNISSSHDKKGE